MTTTLASDLCLHSIGSLRTFSSNSSGSLVDCLICFVTHEARVYRWNSRPIDIQCALDNTTNRSHRSFNQTGIDCVDTRQESSRKRATMGNMFGNLFGKKHYRILMLGLGQFDLDRPEFDVLVFLLLRQCGQNIDSLSTSSQGTDYDDTDRWIQCGNRSLGTREIQCLGCRRTSKIDLFELSLRTCVVNKDDLIDVRSSRIKSVRCGDTTILDLKVSSSWWTRAIESEWKKPVVN